MLLPVAARGTSYSAAGAWEELQILARICESDQAPNFLAHPSTSPSNTGHILAMSLYADVTTLLEVPGSIQVSYGHCESAEPLR